jgi:hypothetical protein
MGFRFLPCTSKCIKSDWTWLDCIHHDPQTIQTAPRYLSGPRNHVFLGSEASDRWRKVGKPPRLLQNCILCAIYSLSCKHVHLGPKGWSPPAGVCSSCPFGRLMGYWSLFLAMRKMPEIINKLEWRQLETLETCRSTLLLHLRSKSDNWLLHLPAAQTRWRGVHNIGHEGMAFETLGSQSTQGCAKISVYPSMWIDS